MDKFRNSKNPILTKENFKSLLKEVPGVIKTTATPALALAILVGAGYEWGQRDAARGIHTKDPVSIGFTQGDFLEHEIEPGETLYDIARNYYDNKYMISYDSKTNTATVFDIETVIDQILEDNKDVIKDPNKIRAGDTIKLRRTINRLYVCAEPTITHVVKHGESWCSICQYFFGDPSIETAKALAEYNGSRGNNWEHLEENQVIEIPKKSELNIETEMKR